MKKLWMVLALMLVGSLSCTTKPIYYELPAAPGFRMHDKAVKSTLVAADSFLVEDSESANTTKYTTMADINTYLGSIYQPLTAYLTDLGDGNITSNFVNTTYPWADNEIASSANWNTAYTERREWDGSDTHLVAGTGRTSLGLGTAATRDAEDNMTDGANLPDGAAIKAYCDSHYGGGSGSMTTVKENNVQVGGADIVTLDFLGADFDLTESPDTEVQVVVAAAIARDSEVPLDSDFGSNGLMERTGAGTYGIATEGTDYLAPSRIDDTRGNGDTGYVWSADKSFDQFELRCLESVFGTSIGTGLLLDGAVLKASTILQKYHGVDPSTDVLAMLGSANDTALVTEIGAEPALTNEAAFYARIVDVSQFYELGDNITTAYGTTPPTTCSVGQIFVDTDADTDGSVLVCVSTNTWKDVGMGPDKDKISEGDSSWEIIDTGTGRADCDIDGQLKVRITPDGLDVNGTLECDGIEVGAVANPRVRALDTNCPGTDKFIGSIDWQYVDGADGAENGDIYLKSQEGGANTTQMQYDESDSAWEIPSGKNLTLLGGSITGLTPVGDDITGNQALNTTDLHGKFYIVTAACMVTMDKVTDVGFGATVMLYIRDAAETCIIEVDNADKINLHGTALDAGDTIDSPGNAGDFICLISHTNVDGSGTDGWITVGYAEAVWSDGGAS